MPQKKEIKPKKNEDFYIPQEKDSIFWCWIIFLYGFSEYEILKENTFTSEKNYKINFIDKIRKNKQLLKELKVKIVDIESNLANESILNIKNLEPMLIIDKFNFVFMNDKIYFENITFPGNKSCIIKYFEKEEKYGIFLEEEKLFEYKNKLFIVDNIIKPIKNISSLLIKEQLDIGRHPETYNCIDKNLLPELIQKIKKNDDIIVFMGAGDIYKSINPTYQKLNE